MGEVDKVILDKLEDAFKTLQTAPKKSLMNKHLTREVFDKIKTRKTPNGMTLLDVIQTGVVNLDAASGLIAADSDAYNVFKELFDPVIEEYHGFKSTAVHPPLTFGDISTWEDLDPKGEFIQSTRIRCGRSVSGYGLNTCMTEADYLNLEKQVSTALAGLTGELKGTYFPLEGMTKEVQQQLVDDHFLFRAGNRFLEAANANHFWPKGRGIFHNDAKTFLVWVNEEDHMRIISMQKGGNIKEVYGRLIHAVTSIEKLVKFIRDPRLGFVTYCPTNLGTTIRASVHIKLPKLSQNKAELDAIALKHNLQVRGTGGEHTESEGGVSDISNLRRLGLTEFQAVEEMYIGIRELIKLEKSK